MRTFAVALIAASACATQTFLAEPTVAATPSTLTIQYTAELQANTQETKETVLVTIPESSYDYTCTNSTVDPSVSITKQYTAGYQQTQVAQKPARIQFRNSYSYFTTIDATADDWEITGVAPTASCDPDYTLDVVEADIKANQKSANLDTLGDLFTDANPTVEPIVGTTDKEYTYGSDEVVVTGDWKTSSALTLGDSAIPAEFSFLYGTVTSTITDKSDNSIGLGPIGKAATDDEKNASLLSAWTTTATDPIAAQAFRTGGKLNAISLGNTTFTNVSTTDKIAKSAAGGETDNGVWTWTQADTKKFNVSYDGTPLTIAEGDKQGAKVQIGNGSETKLPVAYYVPLFKQWKDLGLQELGTGDEAGLYGETDECATIKAALKVLSIQIDDIVFNIPSLAYWKDLPNEVVIGAKTVKCQIEYFTKGDDTFDIGYTFLSDFEAILSNGSEATNVPLQFKTFTTTTNGANIADAAIPDGAFALAASALALSTALLF